MAKKVNPNADVWTDKSDEFADLRANYTVNFRALLKRRPEKPIGLLSSEDDRIVDSFLSACKLLDIDSVVIDAGKSNFFSELKATDCEFYLSRPNHIRAVSREMFLEKETVARLNLGKLIFPTLLELEIYEAKRVLAYFLETTDIPHPKTFVSYSRDEAMEFVSKCDLPQVFKSRNGAGSSGVEIVHTRQEAGKLVRILFDSHYVNKGLTDYRDLDYGYVLFQEFIPNVREFRVIKIGDSWFGHEKSKAEDQVFMSGSGINKWTPPPKDLLDFCNQISEKYGFVTMCFDVFQSQDGEYLVNELQTWFGSYNPSQMYVDGIPGRYIRRDTEWVFEAGLFNDVQSMPLRLIAYINSHA